MAEPKPWEVSDELWAWNTNTGIKAVAAGAHGHTENELRDVRDLCRLYAVQIANATFAGRSARHAVPDVPEIDRLAEEEPRPTGHVWRRLPGRVPARRRGR
ncbi:hypothetical protein [Nonomuraea sp. NPDC049607]|uniref:hypothetical protein n=1 Tax=Nonomuraea sp. NPDC049607 TaxID=3154732 RepID=UPI0034303664